MLSVNNISMRFGPRVLFEDVTCTFMAGRRYAVTGPNGAGKSTFMKILTGELEPTKGSITAPKKIGVLRQDQFAFDEFRVIDTDVMGNKIPWEALQHRNALYTNPLHQHTQHRLQTPLQDLISQRQHSRRQDAHPPPNRV